MVVHPLESSGRRTRSLRGALPSIVVHAAVVLVAVHATAHAALPHAAPPAPDVHFVPTPPAPPVERPAVALTKRSAVPVLVAIARPHIDFPVTVPDHVALPKLEEATPTIAAAEFGRGVAPPVAIGTGVSPERGSAPFAVGDVERAVVPLTGPPEPIYPEALRSSGIRGSVAAEFIVDTTGHIEPRSFRVLSSDNDLFSAAVRAAVLRTPFRPAEAGGRRVRQLVQQRFSFVLQ